MAAAFAESAEVALLYPGDIPETEPSVEAGTEGLGWLSGGQGLVAALERGRPWLLQGI